MEEPVGRSVRRVLETLPAESVHALAICVAKQTFGILCDVHANGYAHGDVNPSNIVLLDGNRVLLIDFGLSHKRAASVRETMAVLCTPAYKARSACESAMADFVSLGYTLCAMQAGVLAFEKPRARDKLCATDDLALETLQSFLHSKCSCDHAVCQQSYDLDLSSHGREPKVKADASHAPSLAAPVEQKHSTISLDLEASVNAMLKEFETAGQRFCAASLP